MRLEIPVGERSMVLETGKLARQACRAEYLAGTLGKR